MSTKTVHWPDSTTTKAATPNLPQLTHARNQGLPLDLDWVASVQANTSAIERRAATLPGRRSVKKAYQAAWLLKAVSLIDLTTLSGDDTPGRVARLCAKARQPVRPDMLEALGMQGLTVGAVCVYHEMIAPALRALEGTSIPVAAVSTGFPAGLSSWTARLQEIRDSVAAGAREIDIVISRRHVLTGNWQALYDEMRAMREAAGEAHVKAILATGDLSTLRNVARASLVCMMGGADFIKTSTGKEAVNATLPVTPGHAPRHPRLRGPHRHQGRLQAGRRHLEGQGRAQLPRAGQRRTRPALAAARPSPLRRLVASRRHRAPARTSPDRPLLGRQPPRHGLTMRPAHPSTGALPLGLPGLTPGYFSQDESGLCFRLAENIPAGGPGPATGAAPDP